MKGGHSSNVKSKKYTSEEIRFKSCNNCSASSAAAGKAGQEIAVQG
jgi:hypothetical protein